jgi:N-acetylglucosamine kinase-like BadF-type ATPase
VLLSGDGAELARVTGTAGIVSAADPAAGAAAATELCQAVAAAAGVTLPVTGVCCGLAGAGREEERAVVRSALLERGVARHVLVTGDVEPAMHDAFGTGTGVLLLAGTGSIAWARGPAAATVRVGGWGAIIGDEGSGYALGVDAIRAVLRAHDGREQQTQLREPVLRATGCADPEGLVRFAASAAKADMAALAPAVLHAATAGDAAALDIRGTAVAALAELAATAARRAGLAGPAVAMAGGLIEEGAPLHAAVAAAVQAAVHGCTVRPGRVDAARGAADMARSIAR